MSHSTAHAAHHPALQHHFDTLEQQQNASTLGMWLFLVTEVLFFGGFFMAYILYRWMYNESFHSASHELNAQLWCSRPGLFAVLLNGVRPNSVVQTTSTSSNNPVRFRS